MSRRPWSVIADEGVIDWTIGAFSDNRKRNYKETRRSALETSGDKENAIRAKRVEVSHSWSTNWSSEKASIVWNRRNETKARVRSFWRKWTRNRRDYFLRDTRNELTIETAKRVNRTTCLTQTIGSCQAVRQQYRVGPACRGHQHIHVRVVDGHSQSDDLQTLTLKLDL